MLGYKVTKVFKAIKVDKVVPVLLEYKVLQGFKV